MITTRMLVEVVTDVGLSDVVILGVRRVYFTNKGDGLMICSISNDTNGETELDSSSDAIDFKVVVLMA